MVTIILILEAIVIFFAKQFKIIGKPFAVFLAVAVITGILVFIFKNKLNCPFAKNCPLVFCPLNKPERNNRN